MDQPQENETQGLTSITQNKNLKIGFKVLHKCPECNNAVQRTKDSAAMECPTCNNKWCWTCGCSPDHWLHHFQKKGQGHVACDLIFKIVFGEGICDQPMWMRGLFVVVMLFGGPMLFWLIVFVITSFIIIIYFVGLIILL